MRTKFAILTASLLLAVGCATSKTKSARMVAPPPIASVAAQTTYSIAPTSATASSSGSTGNIALTVPTWTATSDSSWLSVSPTSGQGNASFVWTAAANTSTAVRTGTLNIAGQLFTVTQDGTAGGGPVNNFFANATIISGSTVTVTGSNVGATKEPGEPNHAGNAGGKSVWWAWTAPVSGSATINTRNSSFDTTLGIYTGSSVSTLGGIAGNDDSGGTLQSSVTFNAVAGITYRIAVDGYNGSSGSITLSISSGTSVCNYSISPTFVSIPADSFTGNITVTADPGCPWTAVSSAPWITTSSAGTGNGIVSYNVQQNTGSARANVITIAGKTFTVNQSSPATNLLGQLQWVKTIIGSGRAYASGVAIDHNNNVIACGYFYGTVDLGAGPVSTSSTFDGDIFLNKYDSQGHVLWIKRIGSAAGNDLGTGVAIDSRDNIVVTGSFTSTVDFGGINLSGKGLDIFAAKYSPSGELLWANRFGGMSSDRGGGIAVDTRNDDVILTAVIRSLNADFGSITLSTAGGDDVVLAKLTAANGAVQWAKRYGGTDTDTPYAVAVDRLGDVVITGRFAGTTDLGTGAITNAGTVDIFAGRYSGTDGSVRWVKALGNSGSDFGWGITTDPNTGNVIVTGGFSGVMNFGGGSRDTGGGGGLFIVAYDQTGNYLWDKTTGSLGDYGTAVSIVGNFLALTGSTKSYIYFGIGNAILSNGQDNCLMASFEFTGNLNPVVRWNKVLSTGTSISTSFGTALDSLGHLFTAGYFTGAPVDFGGITAPASPGVFGGFVAQYNK